MKTIAIASAALITAAASAPAFAQTLTSPQGYAGIGYTGIDPNGHDLGELTGRLGLKLSPYFGVEAEVGTGVDDAHFNTASGARIRLSEQPSATGFAVVYYPITPKFELLARVGYGDTDLKYVNPAGANTFVASTDVAFGAGAQYFLDGKNGIRIDYTRRDYQDSNAPRDMDTWAVGYVHRF
jgi:hypothetical protein